MKFQSLVFRALRSAVRQKSRLSTFVKTSLQLAFRDEIVAELHEGNFAGSGAQASVLTIERKSVMSMLRFFVSGTSANPVKKTVLFSGSLREFAKQRATLTALAEKCDLVVAHEWLAPKTSRPNWAWYPHLQAKLQVADSVESQIRTVRSKAHRRRLRTAVRRSPFRVEISNDEAAFRKFYNELYKPYVAHRFKEEGRIDSYEMLLRDFQREGCILSLENEKGWVAATLLSPSRTGELRYMRNGFKLEETSTPVRHANVTAALEVAVFDFAISRKFHVIDLGYSPSIMNAGLFVHKRRLGCQFSTMPNSPWLNIAVSPERAAEVFEKFPLLAGDDDSKVCVMGARPTPDTRMRFVAQYVRNVPNEGVDEAHVIYNPLESDVVASRFVQQLKERRPHVSVAVRNMGGFAKDGIVS